MDSQLNHHTFEDWLFSEEPLSPRDQQALEEHLQSCESCRALSAAWGAVSIQLKEAPVVEPEPGFTGRWQARLELDHARLHRRQSLAMLSFSIAGAAMLFASLLIVTWPLLQSPEVVLVTWLYRAMSLFTIADVAWSFLPSLFRLTTANIPLLGWMVAAGVMIELAVLWVVSLRWLTKPRRAET